MQSNRHLRNIEHTALEWAQAVLEEGHRLSQAAADAVGRARQWAARRVPESGAAAGVAAGAAACDSGPLHVVPYGDDWAICCEGDRRCSEVFGMREGALERARERARNEGTVLVVHAEDGHIEGQMDYTGRSAARA